MEHGDSTGFKSSISLGLKSAYPESNFSIKQITDKIKNLKSRWMAICTSRKKESGAAGGPEWKWLKDADSTFNLG